MPGLVYLAQQGDPQPPDDSADDHGPSQPDSI
ncbi:unnamed protein product, partial [marine sediment metagenome]